MAFAPRMSAGSRQVSLNMPSFQDFLGQIKEAGILVRGESVLVEKASSSADWTAEVALLARVGRKDGIVFERSAAQRPSNDQLASILRGYSFKPEDANAVIANTMLLVVDEFRQATHDAAFDSKLAELRDHFSGAR